MHDNTNGLFLACAALLIAGAPFVKCTCRPYCKFYEKPVDATVIQGNNARFNCGAEIDLRHHIDWNCNGLVLDPWPPEKEISEEYTYPNDADSSLGTYDIVINNITWERHDQTTYACQISSERMRTRFATLTVIVPPEITMSSLRRDHFLIEVDPTAQEIELSCSTNYATPTFKVEWRIDGVPLSSTNDIRFKRHGKRRARDLMQVVSSANVSLHQRLLGTDTFKSASSQRLALERPRDSFRRKVLEPDYLAVYHISCNIVSSTVESNRIISSASAWVAFKRIENRVVGYYVFGTDTLPVHWYHIVIGVSVILILVVSIVIAVRRKRAANEEAPQKNLDHKYGFEDSKNMLSQSSDDTPTMSSHNLLNTDDKKELFKNKKNPQRNAYVSPLTISTSASDLDECLVPTHPDPISPYRGEDRTEMGRRNSNFVCDPYYPPLHRDGWNSWATMDRQPGMCQETDSDSHHYCRMRSLTDQYSTMRSFDEYHQPSYYSPWPLPTSDQYEEMRMSVRPRLVTTPNSLNAPPTPTNTPVSEV